MNRDIPIIEPTPILKKRSCRVIAYTIATLLSYGIFITFLPMWYFFDLFFAIASTLLSYLIIGIVRAKIRNISIPQIQQEYAYTDLAIATWYTSRVLLCEIDDALTVD